MYPRHQRGHISGSKASPKEHMLDKQSLYVRKSSYNIVMSYEGSEDDGNVCINVMGASIIHLLNHSLLQVFRLL